MTERPGHPSPTPWRVRSWLAAAERRLPGPADDSRRLELEWLLADTLGVAHSRLYAAPDMPIPEESCARLAERLDRRAAGEPLAYVLGHCDFFALRLAVTPEVLIPRPATEILVETALARLRGHRLRVLDAGTGSGAVAVALAVNSQADIVASDRSLAALRVAAQNVRRLAATSVGLVCADWLHGFAPASFDMIISNPPYVGAGEAALDAPGMDFEPRTALVSGQEGLDAIRVLIRDTPKVAAAGCQLVLEHGHRQAAAVRALMRTAGFRAVTTRPDLAGHERITAGTLDRSAHQLSV